MFYVTVKQSPQYHQMSIEEFLFSTGVDFSLLVNSNLTNTRTYEVATVSDRFMSLVDMDELAGKLRMFNMVTAKLRERPRRELYREFYIPKKTGGMRRVDAPEPELMDALRVLKTIFEEDFHALYHTSAFAYIKNRSTIDCVKRHQANQSKWFGKYDLSNFFGSTTLDFVMKQFQMVFPFSQLCLVEGGEDELRTALELAFLDGVLPQGTPVSPIITNIMMIPIDFKLSKMLRDLNGQRYVYTRYADDVQISSKYTFSFREIESLIVQTLEEFNAPFCINSKKTRYGSVTGSNWNLGVMLNKDNEITVGYQKKKRFKATLAAYIMDNKNGKPWDKHDVQVMEGHRNYYRMVEKEAIDAIVDHYNQKFGVDVVGMIKRDLNEEE